MNIQRTIPPPDGEDYETDFHAWLATQAGALRANDSTRLDWPNLLEEIETLGRSERIELFSRVTTIIEHMLKYQHGLNRDPQFGWKRTIRTQKQQAFQRLKQSPSLRPVLSEALTGLYANARTNALDAFEEYECDHLAHYEATLPETMPYALEQVLDVDFFPAPTAAR